MRVQSGPRTVAGSLERGHQADVVNLSRARMANPIGECPPLNLRDQRHPVSGGKQFTVPHAAQPAGGGSINDDHPDAYRTGECAAAHLVAAGYPAVSGGHERTLIPEGRARAHGKARSRAPGCCSSAFCAEDGSGTSSKTSL